jgi:hypothetical protein
MTWVEGAYPMTNGICPPSVTVKVKWIARPFVSTDALAKFCTICPGMSIVPDFRIVTTMIAPMEIGVQ